MRIFNESLDFIKSVFVFDSPFQTDFSLNEILKHLNISFFSDLLKILVPTFIILSIIYTLLRLLFIKLELKQRHVLFEIKPLTKTLQSPLSTQQLFNLIHGLAKQRSIFYKLFDSYKSYAFEIVSTKKEGIRYLLRINNEDAELVKKNRQRKLCVRLEKYVKGSLSNVFNQQTNIKLNNRLVVFDIKDLPESLRQIMILIISNYVYNQVKSNPQKRLLVIDEAWILLQHEESARFIAGLTRRARKYYLGVNIISQAANDFLGNEYGQAIASQSSLRILMRQDTTTIKKVVDEFKLSEYEEKFLLTCDKGEAIVIADQNHVTIKVVASEKEHPLITTDPAEKYSLR